LQKCRSFSVNCCNFVVTAPNKYLLLCFYCLPLRACESQV
jgi:hypothetical protein